MELQVITGALWLRVDRYMI